jgi:hypothetical protein
MKTLRMLLCSTICSALVIAGCSNNSSGPTSNQNSSTPQWGSAFNPSIGDTLVMRNVDTNSLSSPGNSGSSITWDFSSIIINSSNSPGIIFVSPASTPYASSFPTATIADVAGGVYGFSKTSSSANEVLGYGEMGTAIVYQHPLTTHLPMNYQDSQIDTCWYTNTLLSARIWETQTLTYDGVGTLKLPNSITYSNVIRIHAYQVIIDSTSSNVFTSTHDAYQWYKPDYPLFVFIYTTSTNTIVAGSTRTIEINKIATQ